MIFYFSGTGNSSWVAKQIADSLQERIVSIAEEIQRNDGFRYELLQEERIGFVFPVHSWGPPPIVMQFISNLHLCGYQKQYGYFVATCGDDIGCTRQIMHRLCKKAGVTLHAGFSVQMPNTYIALPGFDVDSPSVERKKLADAWETLREIKDIVGQKLNTYRLYPGTLPRLKSYIIRPLFNRLLISDRYFRTTDTCIGCGKCAQICPLHNISIEKKHPTWHGHCTTCMACYHICPMNAISFMKQKGKGQYLHPDLSNY